MLASDLMVKLVNLPKTAQKIIVTLIALSLLLVAASVTVAAISQLLQQQEEIRDARLMLGRLERAIAADEKNPELSIAQEVESSEFLAGTNDAVIQAGLQSKLSEISSEVGATVISSGAYGPIDKGGLTRLGVRANIEGPLSSVYDTLRRLEMATPYLTVSELVLRSPPGTGEGENEVILSAQLTFSGVRMPRRTEN